MVVLAARREDELAALADEIKDQGGSASFVTTDVSVAQDAERMVAHTIETFGRLDYAVNNAGIEGQFAGVVELPEGMGPRNRHQPERHFSVFEVRGSRYACRRTGRGDCQRWVR
jgi:NAD(P)-dependent dehydrogenase (short-subunit alcohol dehydrogenase family)